MTPDQYRELLALEARELLRTWIAAGGTGRHAMAGHCDAPEAHADVWQEGCGCPTRCHRCHTPLPPLEGRVEFRVGFTLRGQEWTAGVELCRDCAAWLQGTSRLEVVR